ncbi:MAG: hypothetical protein JSU98_08510 [Gemmatimonadales bacterium]|nr:MAG: hypothetical protein JSU98_08510 [Gemmatimonadales bacterium]
MSRLTLLALLLMGIPAPGWAQDGEWSVLRTGQLRVGTAGVFLQAHEAFDSDGGVRPLGSELGSSNALTLFPGSTGLVEALRDITAIPGYEPALGSTRSYMQTSQIRVPFQAEIGVTPWLTLGVTVPLVKSRVEGEVSLLPLGGAELGVNPAFFRSAEIQAFTDQLAASAAGLPAGESEAWGAWADRWIDLYGASTLFPAAGTPGGDALVAAVSEFNAVLGAAGLPPVAVAVPLAEAPLTNDGLRVLLFDPAGHYQLLPLPTQLLWGLGDIRLHGRIRVLEGPTLPSSGRPAYGITAEGSIRLPTGGGDEPRALFDLPAGEGHVGVSAGTALWLRSRRFGLATRVRYEVLQSAEVARRVGPLEFPLLPVANTRVVERDPGDVLEVEARPAVAMGRALWIELSYRYLRKGQDRYQNVGPLPARPVERLPYPSGDLYADPSVLEVGTERTVQRVGGGLRYHPPSGDFPAEVWARVELTIAGAGSQALKATRLEFGGRVIRSLWGG